MPSRGEDGVVAEDAAEIVLVGKDLVLQRQEHARRVDEIDQRQAVPSAIRWARSTFFAVIGKNAPALTVASLATIMNRRPATVPMPVTTLADGAPPQSPYIPTRPTGRARRTALGIDQPARSVRGR